VNSTLAERFLYQTLKNVSAPALYGFLASPYLAGGRFYQKAVDYSVGSRVPMPKRMGEFKGFTWVISTFTEWFFFIGVSVGNHLGEFYLH